MGKRFQLSMVIAAIVLVSMITVRASGQTATVPDLDARDAREQRSPSPAEALPGASEDAGIIAYVQMSTQDIHTISPGGGGDRVLWTNPGLSGMKSVRALAWRPDSRELAFSSEHEAACSWYDSDVYAIGYLGAGYRRVTNSPACAELAGLPKGSVTVVVENYTGELAWVYVQGAPEIKSVLGSGTVTFSDVADFGPGVLQPSIGIWGEYRFTSYPPYADVQPGQTVPGGYTYIGSNLGYQGFGAGKVSWKADGSALAYGMRSSSAITQISASPTYGSTGVDLPVVEETSPHLVAWSPTPATQDQYLYSSGMNVLIEDVAGIYLNTVGDASGGTQLVRIPDYSGQYVHDIAWLPDGSGFLFSAMWVPMEICSDIFEYNFEADEITLLTPSLPDEYGDGGARALSISPDGQQIVFERALYPLDTQNSLWIMNRDGSDLHKLLDDAGRPAWGPAYVPQPPHAEFAATPASGVSPLPVQFTNQSTGDYDTCTWTFGDDSTSTSCGNPTHTYVAEGVYTVALTVSGLGGTNTLTRDRYIVVEDKYRVYLPLVVAGH